MERNGLEYRFHFSRANLLSMSFVVFALVLMIPLVLNQETPGYYFAGGILGIVSSVRLLHFPYFYHFRELFWSLILEVVRRNRLLCRYFSFVHFVIWELGLDL